MIIGTENYLGIKIFYKIASVFKFFKISFFYVYFRLPFFFFANLHATNKLGCD